MFWHQVVRQNIAEKKRKQVVYLVMHVAMSSLFLVPAINVQIGLTRPSEGRRR